MASFVNDQPEDAVIQDELDGEPKKDIGPSAKRPQNAFAELMSPKKPKVNVASPSKTSKPSMNTAYHLISGRESLGAYIKKPQSFPTSIVVHYNDKFVVLRDAYPKSAVHLLLLPRDLEKQRLHPFKALDGSDPNFLKAVQEETEKWKVFAASELRRLFSRYSVQDAARNAALDGDVEEIADGAVREDDGHLPGGRDWLQDVRAGVHAHPSMSHLHIHIISVDMHSESLKHRKHYNSFSTPFFVPIEDMPLEKDDLRKHPGREGYLERDLICWRCGKSFGNKFAELKTHLETEFETWKAL